MPPAEGRQPRCPRWATARPRWTDKVQEACGQIRWSAYETHVAVANPSGPNFRNLHYLKEAFNAAAQNFLQG
eukprot:4450797-Alexandrium_andersonii.AAC.1